MDSETVFLKREEVYKMVWSKPVSKLARGYGLSDRGLGKICERLEIPVPGRGYWQMKKNGLQIPVPSLRPANKINATGAYIRGICNLSIDPYNHYLSMNFLTGQP